MRLHLEVLGCRLLLLTGADTETDQAPAVVSNVNGTFEVAQPLEPDVTPEDHYGFHGE